MAGENWLAHAPAPAPPDGRSRDGGPADRGSIAAKTPAASGAAGTAKNHRSARPRGREIDVVRPEKACQDTGVSDSRRGSGRRDGFPMESSRMAALGRFGQFLGLAIPAVAVLLELNRAISLGQMLVMLVAAICCFWIGRIVEGYTRP